MNSLKIKISAFIALSAFATTTTPAFAASIEGGRLYILTIADWSKVYA